MSDSLRQYRAIRDALAQWYPGQPTGSQADQCTTARRQGRVASRPRERPGCTTTDTGIHLCASVVVGSGSDRHFVLTRPLTSSISVFDSCYRMS